MEHEEFFILVAKMRRAQTIYFKGRTVADLEKCRELERQVDREIDRKSQPDLLGFLAKVTT